MKTLPVLACLAVTATAANLKDPAEVAREWSQTVEQPSFLGSTPRKLSEPITGPSPPAGAITFQSATPPPARPSEPLYDAPSYRVPPVLPDNLPPGAKPWRYNDRTYWLIPLGSDAGR